MHSSRPESAVTTGQAFNLRIKLSVAFDFIKKCGATARHWFEGIIWLFVCFVYRALAGGMHRRRIELSIS
ncbi:hypothetical protein BDV10DRAFT_169006 [Aspergillus recurvatus]